MSRMMRIKELFLGRYEIVDLLAAGGQFLVGLAIDQNTHMPVVIKQLATGPDQPNYNEELARFMRQAQLHIGHPNVADPIDSGDEDGERYIIMPYIEGVTLANWVAAQGGRLPPDDAARIALQIAHGLAATHSKRIVHRDIKPENIQVRSDGTPVILDFGICRNLNEQTITQGTNLLGSLAYMSPEQTQSASTVDHRSDIYSLGAVFYFMLTGSPPISGNDTKSIVQSICEQMPASPRTMNPAISPHLEQACMRLLAKQPQDRFQQAVEFIQAVEDKNVSGQSNFCTSCGGQVTPNTRYCPACGAGLGGNSSVQVKCFACGSPADNGSICTRCRRPFSPSDHRLSFTGGSMAGLVFRIPEGIYVVGREEISPRDAHISRSHILVACTNGHVHLQDAGSTNKTYVAGQPADAPTLLALCQEINVGGNVAIYSHT
jgi:serine/threonine protein kinase